MSKMSTGVSNESEAIHVAPVREQGPDRNVVLIVDIKLQSKLNYTTIKINLLS